MNDSIVVNKVELADRIAARIMDDRYVPRGESWEAESEEDPGVWHPKNEEVQNEYNSLYDEAHGIIEECQIKTRNRRK